MMTRGGVSDMRSTRTKSKAPFTILIVEDNATDVELMLHALESADLKPLGGDFDMEVRATAWRTGRRSCADRHGVAGNGRVGARQPHSKDRS